MNETLQYMLHYKIQHDYFFLNPQKGADTRTHRKTTVTLHAAQVNEIITVIIIITSTVIKT